MDTLQNSVCERLISSRKCWVLVSIREIRTETSMKPISLPRTEGLTIASVDKDVQHQVIVTARACCPWGSHRASH